MPKRFGKIFAYTMQKVNNLTWTPGHNGLEERRTDQEAHELTYRAPCDHEYHASLPRFTKPQLFLPEQRYSLLALSPLSLSISLYLFVKRKKVQPGLEIKE